MRRESDYHRSAYIRMCQKRFAVRKELINKIKRADLIVVYLSIRHLCAMAGSKVSYRDGLIDAFRTVYGLDETNRLLEYLDKRRERLERLIIYMLRVKIGGEHK